MRPCVCPCVPIGRELCREREKEDQYPCGYPSTGMQINNSFQPHKTPREMALIVPM